MVINNHVIEKGSLIPVGMIRLTLVVPGWLLVKKNWDEDGGAKFDEGPRMRYFLYFLFLR
jgi:hypothetical protein